MTGMSRPATIWTAVNADSRYPASSASQPILT